MIRQTLKKLGRRKAGWRSPKGCWSRPYGKRNKRRANKAARRAKLSLE